MKNAIHKYTQHIKRKFSQMPRAHFFWRNVINPRWQCSGAPLGVQVAGNRLQLLDGKLDRIMGMHKCMTLY